ncbi:MAG: hypothetical protein RL398_1564, partial [Planctomycetota bacterium]
RFPFLTSLAAAVCLALPATAQKVQVFGGKGERAATTAILFGQDLMAGMSIVYGQPLWKNEYDQMLDKLKGKTNRLGKDWWTTFTTSIAIELGGTKIDAGSYVLGIHCDNDGKFFLVGMDAGTAMKKNVMPFGPQNWTPDWKAPLELHKAALETAVEKLDMELKVDAEDASKGGFSMSWGKHKLTAPMALHLHAGK